MYKDLNVHQISNIRSGKDMGERKVEGEGGILITPQEEITRLLIESGIDVNVQNKPELSSALHIACRRGLKEITYALLKAGAKRDSIDCNGDTPLHLACTAHHSDIVTLLLDAGASVHIENSRGETPLHLCCYSNAMSGCGENFMGQLEKDRKNAYALLKKGADIDKRNYEGMAPMIGNLFVTKTDIVHMLLEYHNEHGDGTCQWTYMHIVTDIGCYELAYEWYRSDNKDLTDIFTKDKYGITSMHIACMKGHGHILDLFKQAINQY